MQSIVQTILVAQARGLSVLVENAGNPTGIDPNSTPWGYPAWLYQAQYNSHGVTYGTDEASIEQAQADFYSDPLREQFFTAYWQYVISNLKSVPNIVGYEIQNEPQFGNLPTGLATTQMVVDPARVIVFATVAGYGPGLPHVDLTDWVTPPSKGDANGLPPSPQCTCQDIAFMAHDYFGARWGSGLNRNPDSPQYLEFYEADYVNVLNGDMGEAPPYIGSSIFHVRWIQDKTNILTPLGIPLIVGEFGIPPTDPGTARFFGSISAAFIATGVSWSMSGGTLDIANPDGSLRPGGQYVLTAAATYP
jgi:hypothetical protein